MAMKHIRYKSLVLAETIYQHVGNQPFVISDLREQGIIPAGMSVGSSLNDLRDSHYIESVEGFRRSHYSNVTKRRMYWRFTTAFLNKATIITQFAAEVKT